MKLGMTTLSPSGGGRGRRGLFKTYNQWFVAIPPPNPLRRGKAPHYSEGQFL